MGTTLPATTILGGRIREARHVTKMSQDAVARASGISRKCLNWIERGHTAQPEPATLQAIAKALGASEAFLRGQQQQMR